MHRWSTLFIPTLREAPADAEVASHRFLLRSGYIRQLGAGIYSYLFLGQRSINKIIAIVREEMDRIGQEFYLPAIHPREVWEQSGRWTAMGDNMFRLKDRKGAELCLGMTHEEIMTSIARNELRSYKQLPQIWYQIQTKFRDEPRPKSGLLRVRQFTMKDSYSFDIDKAGLDQSFDLHDEVYRRIFTRCGLKFVAVEADSGSMGGSQSQEFMCYTDAGEDLIASCPVCGYAANTEKAVSRLEPVVELEPTGDGKPELIHTPGMGAIADISAFLKMSPANDIKCVAYMALKRASSGKADAKPDSWHGVAAFLRGDHQVNETKLMAAVGASELRTMQAEELEQYLHAPAGFLGPVGLKPDAKPLGDGLTVVVDKSLEGRRNLVCGANKLDYHLRNVEPGRDFYLDAQRRHSQRERRRILPERWLQRQAGGRQGGRSRPYLQAGLQVLRVDGRARARRERQGSDAHHGQLRHRHRAHSDRGYRAVQRQERLLAAGLHRALQRGGDGDQYDRRLAARNRRKARRANSKPPAWTCCWMTGMSAPASNSKTLTWWAFLTASTWAKRRPKARWNW